MNTTVSFEMAKALRDAGFVAPEPKDEQFYFNPIGVKSIIISGYLVGRFDSICLIDGEIQTDLSIGDILGGSVFYAPTALEIIAQIPTGTRLATFTNPKTGKIEWACTYDLDGVGAYVNTITDECPHTAAGLAFLAWKKGGEL